MIGCRRGPGAPVGARLSRAPALTTPPRAAGKDIWLALGWCYKRTNRLDLAIEALEEGLTVAPDEAMNKAVDKAGFEALLKRGGAAAGVGAGVGAGVPRKAAV